MIHFFPHDIFLKGDGSDTGDGSGGSLAVAEVVVVTVDIIKIKIPCTQEENKVILNKTFIYVIYI